MNKKEILKDVNRYGKERPWRKHKLENVQYADYLAMLHFKKAHRVSECGNVLRFTVDAEGKMKLAQTWFCHSRLCPLCNWRRANKASNQLKKILREALVREPKGRFLFLTLTAENATGENLKSEIRKMGRAVAKLFQYKKPAKNLLGYVRSTEVTVSESKNGGKPMYHQHMHLLVFVKPTYFNSNQNYINQAEWTKLWQRAMKLDYTPIVNIKVVRPNEKKGKSTLLASAQETAKYQVKADDMLTGNQSRDLQVIDDLEQGLAGSRQVSYGGLLKQIRKDLDLQDVDNGNLVDTESDEDSIGLVVREVVAIWNSVTKNYYLSESPKL